VESLSTRRLDAAGICERVELFLRNAVHNELVKAISSGNRSVLVDFQELDKYDFELADELLSNSEEVLKQFDIAVSELGLSGSVLKIRFTNLPEDTFTKIKDLRSTQLGKMVMMNGIIRQASEVRPEVSKTVWECLKCGAKITSFQTGMEIEKPRECSEFTCGNRKEFVMVEKDFGDIQRVVIEENPENLEGSEQPSRISIILRHDLVDPTFRRKVMPGNIIKITGVMKEMPFKQEDANKRFDIFLEANYLEPMYEEFDEVKINPEDEEKIRELAMGDPWKMILGSIAPSIYGYERIKEAIVLQLFGGVRKQRPDKTWSRGDIHLLMVGDPGSGKSQMLKFVSTVAPKGRYVSGKGASAVGLTASVVKDEFLKGWTLEAGALVLANGGVVCLDEMDKISKEDIFALHEAMEQQSITIAKANIFATLRAETSILAAANPKYSRFDLSTPLAEQIAMPETILSRFDLIFAVKDVPNPEADEKLAEHILSLNRDPDRAKPLIESKLMRKYVAYARRMIKPKISDEALEEIKKFFVELRSKYADGSTVPISPRQLEALVRLTEASARVRLSPIATRKDAMKSIDLLKYALYQLAYDVETGKLDIDRVESGTPASKRNKQLEIMNIIRTLEKEFGKEISKARIIEDAEARQISIEDIEKTLDELRARGYIIEPKQGYVERVD
jgi:replicative DNA helicase Mcm